MNTILKAVVSIMLSLAVICAAGCKKAPKIYYVVNVSAIPSLGGNVAGGGTFEDGKSCTVTASAAMGYNFTNWVENDNVVSTNASYTFNVTGNRILVAYFTAIQQSYTIGVSANPTEGGTVNGGGSFNSGTSRMVTATANEGYTFTNWTENDSVVSTNANYSFTLNANRTLVANFTNNNVVLSAVTTDSISSITQTTAACGGNVTNDGGATVTARGVCWSLNQNPTVSDSHTTDGSGTGRFTSQIIGLTPNKTYYVRAYATNSAGTSYGEQKSFTTIILNLPTVTTNNVTNITSTSATCGGNVTDDGGSIVIERGVCWSTSQNPTIEDDHSNSGTGIGSFSLNLTGLVTNTLYYYRAYATNSVGTAYGIEKAFIPRSPAPTGAINGLFSVSATRQVYFSCGNLQYNTATNIWRFAPAQYNYQGSNNSYILYYNDQHNNNYNGWIDLFGWGTGYSPTLHESDEVYYSTFYDWGINAISNGGNQSNRWRTLTKSEWEYVMFTRNTLSGIRFVMAELLGVEGIILLPDDWSSSIYTLSNAYPWHYDNNIISTTSQWNTLQNAGAVFLPAAGWRVGVVYQYDDPSPNNTYHHIGKYWSKSNDKSCLVFSDDNNCGGNVAVHNTYYYQPQCGFSVRLVRNAQ